LHLYKVAWTFSIHSGKVNSFADWFERFERFGKIVLQTGLNDLENRSTGLVWTIWKIVLRNRVWTIWKIVLRSRVADWFLKEF